MPFPCLKLSPVVDCTSGYSAFAFVLGCLGLCVLQVKADPPAKPAAAPAEKHRVPLAVARDRAQLLHEVFADTLDVVHHHYFRREASVLPARALDDVFARIAKRSDARVRWISVNAPAMNIDHEPGTPFEKQAAKELAAGKAEYSRVEDGHFLRAAPIPLGAGCVRCHTKFAPVAVKQPLLAGLIVAIPIQNEPSGTR